MKRTVLVTGSSRGIGLAVAKDFAACGDRVILNGRHDQVQLDSAVEDLRKQNSMVMGILADMSDYQQAKSVFDEIKTNFGDVDVLINNAGVSYFGLFTDTTPTDWDDIMRHNFNHVLNCTHLAVPAMVQAKHGVIINISSEWGVVGASCEAVYSAAKGAVNAFTKAMAKELGPCGIRVCAIACGAIDTRMNARLSTEERDEFTEEIPLMRFGTVEEVAKLTKFLASKEAGYLTGQVIGLNGGM